MSADVAFHYATLEYCKHLRRFCLLYAIATAALVVSVISDGILTTVRLLAADASMAIFFPIFSGAFEIACAGVLIAFDPRLQSANDSDSGLADNVTSLSNSASAAAVKSQPAVRSLRPGRSAG
jgi:hypothetical protein